MLYLGQRSDALNAPPQTKNEAPKEPRELSSGAATEALLALGLKPVVRELHNLDSVDTARARWEAMGYRVTLGEPVVEDLDTAAMVVDVKQVHTTRHLATHPVIARAVSLGGRLAERLLLDPSSGVHRWLAERLDAERTPHQGPLPSGERTEERRALYVSRERELAERAKALDRMADAGREADGAQELGALLGYPPCCVKAFSGLPRRWPNRFPIEAAITRTRTFHPRLNNLALDRFAWIAWFPCRYDCQASIDLAQAAASAIAERYPERVRRADEGLARPRLYISDAEQAELVGAERQGDRIIFERLRPLRRRESGEESPWHALREATSLEVVKGVPVLRDSAQAHTLVETPLFLPFGL